MAIDTSITGAVENSPYLAWLNANSIASIDAASSSRAPASSGSRPRNSGKLSSARCSLGGDARCAKIMDAANEARIQIQRPDQPESGFQIGVGDDQAGRDLGAVGQGDARHAVVCMGEVLAKVDAGNAAAVTDLDAGGLCGIGQGAAHRTHAAFDDGGAGGVGSIVHMTVQVAVHRIGRARPQMRAQYRIHTDGRLQQGALELLFGNVINIDRSDAQQLPHVPLAQGPQIPGQPGQRQRVTPVALHQPRQGAGAEPGQHLNEAPVPPLKRPVGGLVVSGNATHLVAIDDNPLTVVPEHHRSQVARGVFQTVPLQRQIAGDARSNMVSRCAAADTRKPSANSRVAARPPGASAASSTSTLRPLWAR